MDTAVNDGKPWYQSLTFWTSVATAVLPLVPVVGQFIAANPEAYSAIIGAVFGGLRAKTGKPLVLKR